MRPIFAAAVIAGIGFFVLATSPIQAAFFTVGSPDGVLGSTKCMEVKDNDSTPGTPIQINNCNGQPNQVFQFAGELIYAMTGQTMSEQRCLAFPTSQIIIAKCDTSSISQQVFYADGQLRSINSPFNCIGVENFENGTQLTGLIGCTPGDPHNQWQIKAAVITGPTKLGPPTIFNATGLCMDVFNNDNTSGTPIFVYHCHFGPNQRFDFAGPGGNTIYTEIGQTCLSLTQMEGDGMPIVSAACQENTIPQSFFYYSGQILGGGGVPNFCLEAGAAEDMTPVVATICNGQGTQQWVIR